MSDCICLKEMSIITIELEKEIAGEAQLTKNNPKISKMQLTAELAEATGTSKKIAAQFIESLGRIAYREAKKAGEFTIPGIGKLVKQQRKAREGRNPATTKRGGTLDNWRSVKSPPKSGSVSSAAVERAVKKVANRRISVSSRPSEPQRQKS